MAHIRLDVNDSLKKVSDSLFSSLGLDTETAVKIYLSASIEKGGIPFPVKRMKYNLSTLQAMEDTRTHRNLTGPFNSAEGAVSSMLKGL